MGTETNFDIDETTLILDGFKIINKQFKKSKFLDIGAASGYLALSLIKKIKYREPIYTKILRT